MDDFDRLDALLEQCAKAENAFLAADAALEANPFNTKAQVEFDAAEAAFDLARAKYDALAASMMQATAEYYERDTHYCGLTLSDMLRSRE